MDFLNGARTGSREKMPKLGDGHRELVLLF